MAPSPDDRFAHLVGRGSAQGWVPADDALDDSLDDEFDDDAPRTRPVPGRLVVLCVLGLVVAGIVAYVLFAPGNRAAEVVPGDPVAEVSSGAPQPAGSQGAEVTVHVVGQVNRPSVVALPAGSRVSDALTAAGGPTPDADTDVINLARALVDGEQIVVPARSEHAGAPGGPPGTGVPAAPGAPGAGAAPGTGDGAGVLPGDGAGVPPPAGAPGAPAPKVNINTADAAGLDVLPGVGPATAGAIITHRTEHGPFTSVEQLTDVPGIGDATLESLRDLVTV